jgi:hypothetical protein
MYVGNRQIHEDLGIPFFADHVRTLTESVDPKLSDAGNALVRQLGRRLRLKHLTVNGRGRMYSRPVEASSKRRPSRRNEQYRKLLGYPDWGFPCFSSVIRQMPGYKWKGAQPAYTRSWRPSAQASPILGSTPRHPSNQRTVASWDHPPPVLTCQDITSVSISTSPVIVYRDPFPISSNASWTQEWFNLARDNA